MTVLEQIEETLRTELKHAVIEADLAEADSIPDIILEKPKEKSHGDFATNIAMQLARIAKKAPRKIAEDICAHLNKDKAKVTNIEIAGPGFINFFMKDDFLGGLIHTILTEDTAYGKTDAGADEQVLVEFVSVNPTGDMHLGHARGAAFGDALCNVFAAAGYKVEREYYINDAGNQIDLLAESINARYMQAIGKDQKMPEDGYQGKDIVAIGNELAKEHGAKLLEEPSDARLAFFRDYGLKKLLGNIKHDLAAFRVHFDHWFSETSLYKNNQVNDTIATLAEKGLTYEKEGATWFKSTEFGDDKDRVLVKSDGTFTYLTPDIAYHKNKLDRGFDKIINIWGADHHGYVPRMSAAIQALGYSKEKLSVPIIQLVNVVENGEIVRMSKRTGKAITFRELMDDVGVDAARYFFLMRSNDAKLDFDVDLARSQSNENPVFYVQYAHARICTMLKQAQEKGFTLEYDYDASLLTTEHEMDLLKHLAAFPSMIVEAAERQAPYRVTQYVHQLASLLHRFYNAEKVINQDNHGLTLARIALMRAVQITLANGLTLLGVHAPDKM